MAGRGSLAGLLPFADANAVVVDMANEVLPVSFNLLLLLLFFLFCNFACFLQKPYNCFTDLKRTNIYIYYRW